MMKTVLLHYKLTGAAAEKLRVMGGGMIYLSLTHEGGAAAAVAVIVGPGNDLQGCGIHCRSPVDFLIHFSDVCRTPLYKKPHS